MFKQFSSHKSRKKTPAQAVVEFALALPILLLVMYGLIEAGRLIFIYASVVTASRQAVRYGATIGVNDAGTPHFQDCAGIKAAARRVAFLNTFNDSDILITYDRGLDASGKVVLIPAFNPPDCPIPNYADGTPRIRNGDRIKVQVSTQYSPILRLVPLRPFTITSMGSRTLLVSVPIEVDSPEEGWAGYDFTLTKSASPTTYSAVGQVITYTYTLRNIGTTSIPGPFSIDDNKVASVDCSGVPNPLTGGASATCSGTYVITQKDLDDGYVTNEATALANGTGSNPVTATITAVQKPQLTLAKSASPKAAGMVGQIITYTYTLRNSGNVTLTSPYTISDNKVQNNDISCSGAASPLAPGASTTCSGTYAIKNSDLVAGSVTNHATATAQFGTQTVTSNSASATVLTAPLVLYKAASPTTVNAVGQVITYTYTLYNAGSLLLSSPYSVIDDKVPSVNCSGAASPLAPGASTTCNGTHTVTQADLDAGSIINHAKATASSTQTGGGSTVTSNQASAVVTAVQTGQLTLVKSASPTTAPTVGQIITYTYTLKNTGNLTLVSPYLVADDKVANMNCSAATSPLAPGASTTCSGTYTVTQADLDAGSIINHAKATASTTQTGKMVTSNQASATVVTYLAPRLSLQKAANPTSASAAGQTITYTYSLRNSGNTVFTVPYTVTDDKISSVDCSKAASPLQIGQTTTCTATYTITDADVVAGSVTNHATATAWTGTQTVTSNQAAATITVLPPIACAVRHSALTTSSSGIGMTIFNDTTLYSITIKEIQIYWNNATEPNQKITSLTLGGILISNTANTGSPAVYSTFIGDVTFAPGSNKFLQVNFQSAYKPSGAERILVTFAENGCPILDSSNSSQLAP